MGYRSAVFFHSAVSFYLGLGHLDLALRTVLLGHANFFFIGLLFALLLAALIPSPGPFRRTKENIEATKEAAVVVDTVVWVLIVGLVFAIVLGYLR